MSSSSDSEDDEASRKKRPKHEHKEKKDKREKHKHKKHKKDDKDDKKRKKDRKERADAQEPSISVSEPISDDDYFLKAKEFAAWLSEERRGYIDELKSEEVRRQRRPATARS